VRDATLQLITTRDAAELAAVSDSAIYALCSSGLLPHGTVVHLGRRLRINRELFVQWLLDGGGTWPGGWRRAAAAPAPEATGQ